MKISKTLYFDHQATTPVAEQVLREIRPFSKELCANPYSADHALGWKSLHAVENAAQPRGLR
jgi:cysteine desulfurase